MKRLSLKELKTIQLEILDVVAKFCDDNNIRYWIDCGTLLGAIRHKGYIPWDDDIDIGMLRPDFDKFMQLFNNHNSKYKFHCIENNSNFYYAYGKVLDTTTVLYEPDRNGNKIAVNIDIFVYDNMPDEKIGNKMYDKRDWYFKLHTWRNFAYKGTTTAFRKTILKVISSLLKIFPKNYFIKRVHKNSKRFYKKKAKYVGNFTAYARICCDKSVFDEFITAEFEGKEYKIPVGYDTWLRAFYGDYMKLPPKEKQISHHIFEAYINEK